MDDAVDETSRVSGEKALGNQNDQPEVLSGQTKATGSSFSRKAMTWLGKLNPRVRKGNDTPLANDLGTEAVPDVDIPPLTQPAGEEGIPPSPSLNGESHIEAVNESWAKTFSAAMTMHAGTAANTIRAGIVQSLVTGIRSISSERDRDEILRWFIDARQVLSDAKLTKSEAAAQLYKSVDTLRAGKLVANIAVTSLQNYRASSMPLALKVALPVTALGTAIFGAQGAGIAAFGTAMGAPVALLLFLGTAGATSIIEAFIRDRSVRDPLTKLMLTFVAFETSRRAKKELLAAMRADAMTPLRATVPDEDLPLLQFLLQMDPILFERHVMSFFEQCGHPTGLTTRSNDFGVDGYVFHPDGIVIVQCKRYSIDNPVGRPAIQQFKGVIEEQQAFRGYFVTTSRFTDEAHESAEKSNRIVLVDGAKLIDWHHGRFPLS
jgi:restriction system protein